MACLLMKCKLSESLKSSSVVISIMNLEALNLADLIKGDVIVLLKQRNCGKFWKPPVLNFNTYIHLILNSSAKSAYD
jgi:hypothetical protein